MKEIEVKATETDMKPTLLLYAVLSTLSLTLAVRQKWVYSGRARDRGDQLVSDLIDIDANHEDAQLEVDGSGSDADEDGEHSGDDPVDEASGDTPILSVCELHRRQAIGQSASGPVIGAFIPRCTDDGYFELLQCHSSTGDCWCVDQKEGVELIGSRQRVPSMPDCTRFTDVTKWQSSSAEKTLRTTSVEVIPDRFSARTTASSSLAPSTSSARDEPSNKIDHFPNELDKKFDDPSDFDDNKVERPEQIGEPRRRKLSLRASVIGQPGILAGIIGAAVVILLCLVLLVMFCAYRMHLKSQDPEIFYIDKTARMPLSSNKKVGYMKALNQDHDMYN